MSRQLELVSPDEIRAAVAGIRAREAAGEIQQPEAGRRIAACRAAVTPRDLWKATDGRSGLRRRQDWWDVRRAVFGLLFILVLCALLVWLVTWAIGLDPTAAQGLAG